MLRNLGRNDQRLREVQRQHMRPHPDTVDTSQVGERQKYGGGSLPSRSRRPTSEACRSRLSSARCHVFAQATDQPIVLFGTLVPRGDGTMSTWSMWDPAPRFCAPCRGLQSSGPAQQQSPPSSMIEPPPSSGTAVFQVPGGPAAASSERALNVRRGPSRITKRAQLAQSTTSAFLLARFRWIATILTSTSGKEPARRTRLLPVPDRDPPVLN